MSVLPVSQDGADARPEGRQAPVMPGLTLHRTDMGRYRHLPAAGHCGRSALPAVRD